MSVKKSKKKDMRLEKKRAVLLKILDYAQEKAKTEVSGCDYDTEKDAKGKLSIEAAKAEDELVALCNQFGCQALNVLNAIIYLKPGAVAKGRLGIVKAKIKGNDGRTHSRYASPPPYCVIRVLENRNSHNYGTRPFLFSDHGTAENNRFLDAKGDGMRGGNNPFSSSDSHSRVDNKWTYVEKGEVTRLVRAMGSVEVKSLSTALVPVAADCLSDSDLGALLRW